MAGNAPRQGRAGGAAAALALAAALCACAAAAQDSAGRAAASDDPEAAEFLQPGPAAPDAPRIRPRARPERTAPALPGHPVRPQMRPQAILDRHLRRPPASGLRPHPRPGNFADIVAASREMAARREAEAYAPKVPTSSRIARIATARNRLGLSKAALVGTFGKPGSRGAIVRLADGGIRRVEVGDPLDGGQVTAIGEGSLSYLLESETIVLRMPGL